MRRILCTLALVAGAIAPATGVSTALADEHAPPPGLGIRLVDVPVAAADNPRARVYIIDHVKPGSEVERRVQVVNNTPDAAEISIYAAAADIEGGSFIGAEGRTQNELSSWTSVTPGSAQLEQGGRTFADVTITIPPDASPGERYATVWAEVTTPPDTAGGITQVSRVGVRIYLSVGPGGEPASDFVIRSFTAERDATGAPVVQLMVHNTGGRALDLAGDLSLSDGPGGLSAGPFELSLPTTLGIDQTEPVTVALAQELPDGPWRAEATLRSGLLERSAHATLTFPSAPGAAAPVTAESDGGMPWLLLSLGAAVLLLLLAALLWLLWRRRSSAERRRAAAASPEAAHASADS
jgi:hypothetical protein